MFRILRTFPVLRQPPPLSSLSQRFALPPTHRSLSLHNGLTRVQRVRFRGPSSLRARTLSTIVKPLAWGALFYYIVGTLFDDDEEDEPASESAASDDGSLIKDAEKDSAVEKNDTFFIPLGFAYQLPQTFYKGSDPEWQSFIQLSRNKKKCSALKNELTGFVGEFVGAIPQMERALGKGNVPKRHWLDIDFPDGPPPEYERKGLEITVDHISWTTRPVHPLHYMKLQKALWPTSLASSIWASYKTMASLQYAKLRSYLKLSSEAESSTSTDSPGLSLPDIHQKMWPPKQEPAATSESDQMTGSSALAGIDGQPPTSQTSSDSSKPFQLRFPPPGVGEDLASAATAFKTTFSKTWRPVITPPERGTVLFSGMVELVGPKGVAVLDVRGAYHAAESRWTTLSVAVRRLQSRKQGPRGGR
ncbi:MAG: hypothetical protein L6R38_004191 [Xanthoria sp. 2 TBL-2021]|nr:MAG: hypothetical protein L6R38_004191 [Xanthoria sp. 2 TBL-2021]